MPARESNRGGDVPPVVTSARSVACVEGGILGWSEPGFVQEYTVESDGTVIVVDRVRDPATDAWTSTARAGDVSFAPYSIASAGRDDFGIVGVDESTGETVIERWRLTSRSERSGAPLTATFETTVILRERLPLPPVELGLDPGKRFLLLLAGPPVERALYQVPLVRDATPVLLHDARAQPVLAQAWMIDRLQHAMLGRIWMVSGMTDMDAGQTMILVDSDDDGAFDGPPIVGSQESLEEQGLFGPAQILDAFQGDRGTSVFR